MSPFRSRPQELEAPIAASEDVHEAVGQMVRQFADPMAFLRELVQNGIDAGATGLFAVQGPAADPASWTVRHQGLVLEREVGFTVQVIRWDGKEFKLTRGAGKIAAGEVGEVGAEPVTP